MTKVANFQDVFLMEISDMYNAEQQLTKALKKMASAASDPELQQHLKTILKKPKGR